MYARSMLIDGIARVSELVGEWMRDDIQCQRISGWVLFYLKIKEDQEQ